ncbi:MAG: hypothetical protein IJ478_06395 [Alistipes sp.]|nr:hypothetical protein [Alistipes sp.]
MKAKMNSVDRWYKQRMLLSGVAAPVVAVVFIAHNYDMGVASWGFGLLVLLVGLLELLLALSEYRTLDIVHLSTMSMTEATERVCRHRKMVARNQFILSVPLVVVVVWTVLYASRFTLNLPIIVLTSALIALSLIWGFKLLKRRCRQVDEVLHQIEQLRQ